jgi:hypothetical protein
LRISYITAINICIGASCKSKAEIEEVLSKIYFTEYLMHKQGNLYHGSKVYVKKINEMTKQFMPDPTKYIDTNNFIDLEKVSTKDSRLNFLQAGSTELGVHIVRGSEYSSSVWIHDKIIL